MKVEETAIMTKLKGALQRKTPITKMKDASDLLESFQQEAVPLIANVVQNEQEIELAVEIITDKLQFKTKKVTYGEISDLMGYSRSAYDHHLYPTAYDLDEEASTFSPLLEGVEIGEAMILLNNHTEFRRLLDQKLVESSKDKCPRCKIGKLQSAGTESVSDHHQINYMKSYSLSKCDNCGYVLEEEIES